VAHVMGAALLLGIAAGMRAFTPPAVVYLWRGGIAGIVLAVIAVVEMIGDLRPNAGSRTYPPVLALRLVSGAFVGWTIGHAGGAAIAGAVLGGVGALAGAYGGLALRLKAIEWFGRVPAALAGDVVAVGLAVAAMFLSRVA
jgi:uncharacterized membrane protein